MHIRSVLMVVLLVAFLGGLASDTQAQETSAAQEATNSKLPDRIIRPMRAVDPVSLRAEGVTIQLWGIKSAHMANTPLELQALDMMDGLIQEQQVNCKITGGSMPELTGRCATQDNQDLALELLTQGFAVVDRRQTYNSVFATAYEKAQEAARLGGRGVWAALARGQGDTDGLSWMRNNFGGLILILLVGPFLGLVTVGLILWRWLSRLSDQQRNETQQSQRKEAMLQQRERQVLVTTLEGELAENKNKIEAFLVIYGDMLRDLRDGGNSPKYQQAGDIVQKHPNFSKVVFEANVGKLSLLDIKLAGNISKLYSSMPKEQEYINLDPGVPLETAVKLVEKVLKEAEDLLGPISKVVTDLQAAIAQPGARPAAGPRVTEEWAE